MKTIVNSGEDLKELILLIKDKFSPNTDVVTERYIKKSTGEHGYSMMCDNYYKNDCPKKNDSKYKCKYCEYKVNTKLTDDLLLKHLNGEKFLIVHPMLTGNTCKFISIDFDDHEDEEKPFKLDPYKDMKAFIDTADMSDINCSAERSRSGNGYHAHIIFDQPVPAVNARSVANHLLEEAQLINYDKAMKSSSYCSMYPKQDTINSDGGSGNGISLPFNGNAAKSGNTLLLDPETAYKEPFKDQVDALKKLQTVPESLLDEIIKEYDLKAVVVAKKASIGGSKPYLNESITEQIEKMNSRCAFLKHAYENPNEIGYQSWFDLISILAKMKQNSKDLCHLYSKGHVDYKAKVTDDMILNTLNFGPHTCKTIRENDYGCKNNCSVKSPAALFNKFATEAVVEVNNVEEALAEIIELSKNRPAKAVEEILRNGSYVNSLAALSKDDLPKYELLCCDMKNNTVLNKDIDVLKAVIKDKAKKKANLKLVRKNDVVELPKVTDEVKGAPVPDTIITPAGWRLFHGGIRKIAVEKIILSAPLLIKERLVNLNDNTELVELTWLRDGKWLTHIVEKEVIATTKLITTLSNYGVPVNSLKAKDLVEFLSDFEAKNISSIPVGKTSSHLGWQKGKGFLLGNKYICPANINNKVTFRGEDTGDDQFAKTFKEKGSYEEWIRIINLLYEYPKVVAAMYFSLIPPFLDILESANFTVDWSGETSKGKTTTLRVAGSSWGSPDEKSESSIVRSWSATSVWIERTAALLNGLPLILDDTKNIGKTGYKDEPGSKISEIIYNISSGQGKGRGTIKGIRASSAFRTVLLSSGEQAATDFTNGDGGSRARVISIWGTPFGASNKKTAALVNDINQTLCENYGHSGEKVIKFIMDHKADWSLWKDTYRELKKYYSERAGQNSVANRMSEYFATLATVIPIVHAAMPELRRDKNISEIIDHLWKCSMTGSEEADRAKVAFEKAYEWAVSNKFKFYSRQRVTHDSTTIPPHDGWAGAWKDSRWEYIAFQTSKLKKILKNEGFEPEAILKTWKDRGWLETDKTGMGKKTKIDGNSVNCYCLKKSEIDKILGVDSEETYDDD